MINSNSQICENCQHYCHCNDENHAGCECPICNCPMAQETNYEDLFNGE